MAHGGQREGAGRKKAKHTILAETARKKLIAAYIKHIKPINEALIKKATSGDIAAIKELHDRVYGRPVQPIAGVQDEPLLVRFDNSFHEAA